jgi:hypothetical protein
VPFRRWLADLGEHEAHRLGVDPAEYQRHAGIALRAHHAEDVGRLETMVAHRAGPDAGRCPQMSQRAFLANPGLALESDFQPLGLRMAVADAGERAGEVFLNVSWAVFGWMGRGFSQEKPIRRSTACIPPWL